VKFINVDSDAQIIEYMETIKTCHPGECFGEVALTMNKPRFGTATVPLHLIEPCYLASLDKTAYETTFLNSNNELDQKMKAIERVFPNVPSNVLIRLSYNFQPKEYQHNEIVYQEGQLPDCFHMIVLGEVSIEAY
jgi:CRP-like cAMP-binding protein